MQRSLIVLTASLIALAGSATLAPARPIPAATPAADDTGASYKKLMDSVGPAMVTIKFVMKMEGGRCAAYRDKLDDGKCGCSIHAIRPDICREFEAGTPDCHAARKRRGIE